MRAGCIPIAESPVLYDLPYLILSPPIPFVDDNTGLPAITSWRFGWFSLFCFFSKSNKKGALVFLSRYKKNFFNKFFLKIFTNYFCHFRYVVDRFDRLKKNQELHQTKMMFNLIEECNIKYSQDVSIDIDLPFEKLIFSQNSRI